jgi:hypothetical protein
MLGAAVSIGMAGILLLALDRILHLLTEIRDALSPAQKPAEAAPERTPVAPRSADDIAADIRRMSREGR